MPVSNMIQITSEIWGAVFSLICIGIIFAEKEFKNKESRLLCLIFLLNFILLTSDALAWFYRGNTSEIGGILVRITNLVVFLTTPLIVFTVFWYLILNLKYLGIHPAKEWGWLICCIVFLDYILIISSQFNGFLYYFDESNLYHRAKGYWICVLLAESLVFILFLIVLLYRKQMDPELFLIFMLFIFLPLLSSFIQLFNYGISLNNLTVTVCLIILFMNWENQKSKRYHEQEKLLMEKNTQIVMTQIQPHFLYNALAAISYLCEEDPLLAKHATEQFSDYLRMNMNSLQKESKITFSKELEHTKTYLWIEQLRFQEKLQVQYDIQCTNFSLPALSLQPLVENAVRHGICKKENGGKIRISAFQDNHHYYVQIVDNGVGFDPLLPYTDKRQHFGIENTRKRLEILCNGKLEISSQPQKGTTATIILPK